MTVRRTQKAINTINSFVQYSKGQTPGSNSLLVFKAEPRFKPGGLVGSGGVDRELHSLYYEGSGGGSGSFSPQGTSQRFSLFLSLWL